MPSSDNKLCRICLSSNQDDNITYSFDYIDVFIQCIGPKVITDLWLCMWCKRTLKKTKDLIALANKSHQILNSENTKMELLEHQKLRSSLSITSLTNIDILPTGYEEKCNTTIHILNTDNINNTTMKISKEIDSENELKFNEILVRSIDFIDEDTKLEQLNINTPKFNNTEIETLKKNIKPLKYTKSKKLKLKLEELKFEMKYLNLDEQMKQIEMKRLKYKHMRYQCNDCGVGFLTSDVFEQHKIKHTEASGHIKCPLCGLHFSSQGVLSQHTLSHRRVLSCSLCAATFNKWSNCVSHRDKCGTSVRHTVCLVCRRLYTDEHSLKIHLRIHNVKLQYTCEHCDRKFTTKQRLDVHIRSHTGQKPFSCTQCERSFTTHSNLRAHSSVHRTESTHYCVECNTYYKTAKSLNRHLNESVRHLRERNIMLKCKQCDKIFNNSRTFQQHVTTHNGVLIQCTLCQKTFSNKSNLNKHLRCIHKTTK
ncbi:uncharacterized protein LOC142985626 [Anticarsia gemmatalis]|uniref:uncharacterized protein LOC142985626 n=1 Tax=Anticarsia gemmatalis TaxID=129554 RepID=UPI003F7649D6